MRFIKMHGAGNDYVYINCFEENVADPAALSPRISERHFGVGSDGLVLIMPSEVADCRMRMFNPDGSEAEMCGNAVRCVAKYVYEHKIIPRESIAIETGAGIKTIDLTIMNGMAVKARVDMGEPELRRSAIPMQGPLGEVIDEELPLGDTSLRITCVSMGNPHAVIYIDDVASYPVREMGPRVENHPSFPRRTNVHFVQCLGADEVRMRTWERGAGETLACGTGAAAVGVASHLNGFTGRTLTTHVSGGELLIEWAVDNHVYMTGPAMEVFTGEWPE